MPNLGRQGCRLIVFDESRLRCSCHATVGGDTDGHEQMALVVLKLGKMYVSFSYVISMSIGASILQEEMLQTTLGALFIDVR